MKIVDVECHVVVVPDVNADACSSAQDDIVVVLRTDEGISGVGETDSNPWAVKALIEAPGTHCMALSLKEMVIGADPMNPEALWEKLYTGSIMTGRRGLGICAIGAIDMAVWDIRGKALGLPCWQLLGGARSDRITPYASLLPTGDTLVSYQDGLVEQAVQAKARGFRAAKLEVCLSGPWSHNRLQEPDAAFVETVARCREAVGAEMTLMVDAVYAFRDRKRALNVITAFEPYDIFFVETPLRVDDLEGHAWLADHSPVRVASGEWLQTRFEFMDLIDRGGIDVAQPDIGRVGGLTEAKRVADIAADRGRLIVPHCWKTAIGIAASAHLAAATPHCPYIEYLPAELSDSAIRKELAADGLTMVDGQVELPTKPGLGIELNREALEKYRAA